MLIDILQPVSKIFEQDEWVSQINKEKLAAVSNGLSVKQFCNKWTAFTLRHNSGLDETDVEVIDECLKKYGLDIDMNSNEINKYQDRARSVFGLNLSEEESVILKSNKKNMEQTKTETKEFIVSPQNISPSQPDENNNVVDDDKMFSYTLKCMKELGIDVKSAKKIVFSYFENEKKKTGTTDVSQGNPVKNRKFTATDDVLSLVDKRFRLKDLETVICKLGYAANSSGVIVRRFVEKNKVHRLGWGTYEKVES